MSGNYFQPVDGHVLLSMAGTYTEHQIYIDDDQVLYARRGNGYIRLMDHAATSKAKVFWRDIRFESEMHGYEKSTQGRLVLVKITKKLRKAA